MLVWQAPVGPTLCRALAASGACLLLSGSLGAEVVLSAALHDMHKGATHGDKGEAAHAGVYSWLCPQFTTLDRSGNPQDRSRTVAEEIQCALFALQIVHAVLLIGLLGRFTRQLLSAAVALAKHNPVLGESPAAGTTRLTSLADESPGARKGDAAEVAAMVQDEVGTMPSPCAPATTTPCPLRVTRDPRRALRCFVCGSGTAFALTRRGAVPSASAARAARFGGGSRRGTRRLARMLKYKGGP